jgi:histone acetyltransferase
MLPKVKYKEAQHIILTQRKAIFEKIRAFSKSHVVYPGLEFKKGQSCINPQDVPGLSMSKA